METINDPRQEKREQFIQNNRKGRIAAGIFLIAIGIMIALKKSGADIPDWLFSWKTLLIAIGLFIGIKHRFRTAGWLIPVCVGSFFLVADFYSLAPLKMFLAPAILVGIGLYLIFKPKRNHCSHHGPWGPDGSGRWNNWTIPGGNSPVGAVPAQTQASTSNEDRLEINAVFSGVKKNIISKNFKGGEINSVFGGAEVNLMNADFTGVITIEATQVLGGTKLIIPPSWQVQSELTAVLGGVEDRRPVHTAVSDSTKVLRLTGTCVLGGLEIQSF